MAVPISKLKKFIAGVLDEADLNTLSAKMIRRLCEEHFKTDLTDQKQVIDDLIMEYLNAKADHETEEKIAAKKAKSAESSAKFDSYSHQDQYVDIEEVLEEELDNAKPGPSSENLTEKGAGKPELTSKLFPVENNKNPTESKRKWLKTDVDEKAKKKPTELKIKLFKPEVDKKAKVKPGSSSRNLTVKGAKKPTELKIKLFKPEVDKKAKVRPGPSSENLTVKGAEEVLEEELDNEDVLEEELDDAKPGPSGENVTVKGAQLDDATLARQLQQAEWNLRERPSRRPVSIKSKEKPKTKRANSMYSRKCVLSDALASLLNESEMSRHDVVKKMWSIAQERKLFDPKNKQFIICDEQLALIFGRKRVRMFGMMKYLKNHVKDLKE